MSVHIIAEAGSNYNGDVALAKQLNRIAARAGADSIKYQIIYPEGLYRPGSYAYGHYDIKEVWRIREEGVLTDEQWTEVCRDAIALRLTFSASVFDTRGLDLLCSFDPPYIKTASCDLNNIRFLREIAARGKPMVVSTGMSSLGDIEKAVVALSKEGIYGERLVLLHCVSAYPSPLSITNLSFIKTLKSAFGTAVGFSDHTLANEAACVAVALGATWIEKHFTVDQSLSGFDHKYAMHEDALTKYINSIRSIELSMRPKLEKIGEEEAYTRQRARRGLYVNKTLPAGHVLKSEDIAILRPEGEVNADEVDSIVGQQLKKSVSAFEPISLDIFE